LQALTHGAELAEGLGNEAHAAAWRAALASLGLADGGGGEPGVAARGRKLNLALLACLAEVSAART
jgi:hypothetical protein